MSVSQTQFTLIQNEIQRISEKEQITILWACESGSRAWGFESTDSDYDVRFIYIRRPEDYLRVSKLRDVIEVPISDELDISGWDLSKALGLLRKSNPPLLEWLQSPIVYSEFDGFKKSFWNLANEYFCPRSCMYHYMSMADRNRRSYLETELIRLKRYFYMLRPVLACQWLLTRSEVVPMKFSTLVDELVPPGDVKNSIDKLVKKKREGVELGEAPVIQGLSQFIIEQMESLAEVVKGTEFNRDWEPLDNYFRYILSQTEQKDQL